MARHLTQGEIALAQKIYGDSLNYREILIHNGKYPLSLYLQPANTAMAPNGEIYFDGKSYLNDYTFNTGARAKSLFLHEMMHVWQYQNKVYGDLRGRAFFELLSHGFDYKSAYPFTLLEGKDLLDYNMEQQASIIELYYLLRFHKEDWNIEKFRGDKDYHWRIENTQNHYSVMKLFQSVLKKLMENPSYAKQNYRFW